MGMLAVPKRTAGGYRQYDVEAVRRIRFIKHAQALGFSLKEIRDLLALRVRHGAACGAIERKTRDKIALIDDKLRELTRLRRTMVGLVTSCEARKTTAECPVLEILEEDDFVTVGGGVVAAIASTLCCAGPLVAVSLGVSSAGLARIFEPLRPVFVIGAVAALGYAHWTVRRTEQRACEPGTLCASPRVQTWTKW